MHSYVDTGGQIAENSDVGFFNLGIGFCINDIKL